MSDPRNPRNPRDHQPTPPPAAARGLDPYGVDDDRPLSPPPPPRALVVAIDEHVPCAACGYDLFGLRRDGVCPECGTPAHPSAAAHAANPHAYTATLERTKKIARDEHAALSGAGAPASPWLGAGMEEVRRMSLRHDSGIIGAPRALIRRMQAGFVLMIFGVALAPIALIGAVPEIGLDALTAICAALLLASLLWSAGLLLISAPLPDGSDSGGMTFAWVPVTRLTLISQSAWPLLTITLLAAAMQQPPGSSGESLGDLLRQASPGPWLSRAVAAAVIVGLLGLLPMSVMLARRAAWCRDDHRADALRRGAAGMCVLGSLAFLTDGLPLHYGGFTLMLLRLAIWLGMIWLVGRFVFSIVAMAKQCGDAVRNQQEAQERNAEKIRVMEAEQRAHAVAMASAPAVEPPDLTRKIGVAPTAEERRRRASARGDDV